MFRGFKSITVKWSTQRTIVAAFICTYICMCVYVCTCVCVYVCVYIYICHATHNNVLLYGGLHILW